MAESRATGVMLFIGLIIYFVFFIFIVAAVDDLAGGTNLNNSLLPGRSSINTLAGFEQCQSPRYKYDPTSLTKVEYNNIGLDNLACEESKGTLSEFECENIANCNWENVTDGDYLFGLGCYITGCSTFPTCTGDINGTYYGINVTDPIVGRNYMTQHNNTNAIGGFVQEYSPIRGNSKNICLHPNVVQNETLCELFSCSWGRTNIEIDSPGDIISLTSQMFTFDYDFGITDPTLNTLMYFIFIILPGLLIIFSLYLMVR